MGGWVGWLVGWEFNGLVNTINAMSNRPVYLTTLFLDWLNSLSGQPVLGHILPPKPDNWHSLISGRENMTVENIS